MINKNRGRSPQPAFTLLELLIVITIIGVLTSILVLNFVGVRQRQELTLMVDQAVAMLQQTRAEVSSGKVRITTDADGNEVATFLCEGAYFEVESAPLLVYGEYDSETDTCTAFETELYGLSTGGARVDEITVDGASMTNLYVLYLPPEGNVTFYSDGTSMAGDATIHFDHAAELDLDLSVTVSSQTNLVTLSLGNEEE